MVTAAEVFAGHFLKLTETKSNTKFRDVCNRHLLVLFNTYTLEEKHTLQRYMEKQIQKVIVFINNQDAKEADHENVRCVEKDVPEKSIENI